MEEAKKFKELYEMPCEGHSEEKNGLAYLSWAYAWATLLEQDPNAVKKIYEGADGSLVWKDPVGCHVKVSVTAFGVERIEYLPVMDYKNQSVPFDKVDSMMVNKTIQRAVTKAIAQFGIGLKLYAGEDLPDGEGPKDEPKKEPAKNQSGEPSDSQKLIELMKGLDTASTAKFIDWCLEKFNVAPTALTDPRSVKYALVYLQAAIAKSQKGKPLTIAGEPVKAGDETIKEKADDDLPF